MTRVWAAVWALSAVAAEAHPHVFVDGGVDFVMGENAVLEALEVTWLYDRFETLYTLSDLNLDLRSDGTLAEADRQELVRQLSDWPSDFDGSAHVSVDGVGIAMDWPEGLDAQMIDGAASDYLYAHIARAAGFGGPAGGGGVLRVDLLLCVFHHQCAVLGG